jgi:hypothetical protein
MDGENATVLAGEMSNGAGPSTNIRLGLGVQGAKIARTIKTFNDVCVYFSYFSYLSNEPLIAM